MVRKGRKEGAKPHDLGGIRRNGRQAYFGVQLADDAGTVQFVDLCNEIIQLFFHLCVWAESGACAGSLTLVNGIVLTLEILDGLLVVLTLNIDRKICLRQEEIVSIRIGHVEPTTRRREGPT